MALIEGVGDEVVQFFVLVLLAILAVLAWWSTRISERPLIRTVLIVERTNRRNVTPPNESILDSSVSETNITDTSVAEEEHKDEDPNSEIVPTSTGDGNEARIPQPQSLVAICKQRIAESSDGGEAGEESSSSNGPATETQSAANSSNTQVIRIRLKYLNDDLKLVEGDLHEQLGEFKRRHFRLELSGRKLVRLIFNGHVLGQDTNTLAHYGLFDNCVVHCVVQNARTPPPSPDASNRTGAATGTGDTSMMNRIMTTLADTAMLNLLLVMLFTAFFSFAWYARIHFAQLFSTNTTVALIGLTVVFAFTTVGLYMAETN